jgi:DNA modification methylase
MEAPAPEIRTPKRNISIKSKKELFPYYAGFSEQFTEDVLKNHPNHSLVLDPWNGSGTTTYVTQQSGFNSIGLDLNPVMVVVAKARLASAEDIEKAIANLKKTLPQTKIKLRPIMPDPLEGWIGINAALYFRAIFCKILGSYEIETDIFQISAAISKASASQCFAILTIFRVIKRNANTEKTSNPTWVKTLKSQNSLEHSLSLAEWASLIINEADHLSSISLLSRKTPSQNINHKSEIFCASSEQIPLDSNTIDIVLTSPPYCTRIDYAKSTLIELSILGISPEKVNTTIRRSLMGTTAIKKDQDQSAPLPSGKCTELLENIQKHPSSGSKSYYSKNFRQYFISLNNSIAEISRVLKPGGSAYIVVQGSHYKELEIDLPGIFCELSSNYKLILQRSLSFDSSKHFGRINIKSLKYKSHRPMTEQVLVLQKHP